MILLAAFNLDFLCIHPFRDGNGRVFRLLLLQTCYHLGLEVGRYISLERIIEQNKERYYETLRLSSQNWHEGTHDPWPYIGYLLFILKQACQEFSVTDLQKACPGVSVDLIRRTLKVMQDKKQVKCVRKGRMPNGCNLIR